MIKRKALEPLIASILLIVVAVILVTIVLAWGKNFTTDGLAETNKILNDDCSATIKLSDCDWNSTSKGVSLFIKNLSSKDTFAAGDFVISVTEDGNIVNSDLDNLLTTTAISPGATVVGQFTAEGITDTPTKVNVEVRSKTCPTVAVQTTSCQ